MRVNGKLKSAFGRVEPGKYHFEVLKIEDTIFPESGDPCTKISLRVCAGDQPAEIGKTHTESISHYHKNETRQGLNQAQIVRLAEVLGATFGEAKAPVTFDSINAAAAAGEDIVINWDSVAGKHFIGFLEPSYDKDEKNHKSTKYSNLDQGKIFSIDDPHVANVPRDQNTLNLASAGDVF